MVQIFGKPLGDPFYDSIEPSFYLWAHHSYIQDIKEHQEFSRQLGLFVGSFANPKMAQDIINSDKNTVAMDDESFDALSEFVANIDEHDMKNLKKKKRKLLLNKKNI